MRKQPDAQIVHITQPTQRQQVFLHAVVGSLVLCAVLVPPAVQSSGPLASTEQRAAQPSANNKQARHVSPQPLRGNSLAARAFLPSTGPAQADVAVRGNMTANANGKQLAMRLEFSRAQTGNLLQQQLAIP